MPLNKVHYAAFAFQKPKRLSPINIIGKALNISELHIYENTCPLHAQKMHKKRGVILHPTLVNSVGFLLRY